MLCGGVQLVCLVVYGTWAVKPALMVIVDALLSCQGLRSSESQHFRHLSARPHGQLTLPAGWTRSTICVSVASPEGSVIVITRNQDVKKEAAAKCQMRHDVCAAYAVKGRTKNKL